MSQTDTSWNPPSLWSTQPHFRTTRKGKVLKNVNERYLRDDLGLGFLLGRAHDDSNQSTSTVMHKTHHSNHNSNGTNIESTQQLLSMLVTNNNAIHNDKIQIVVCDTNVLLHNLDILEHASCAISNIVIPQTSLAECKKNSLSAYNRVINLLREADWNKRCVVFFPNEYHVETQISSSSSFSENNKDKMSDNDVNDAKIRQVASFLGAQLKGTSVQVILLTDDYQSRLIANQNNKEGNNNNDINYIAQSVRHHVKQLEKLDPSLALSDLVAQFTTPTNMENGNDNGTNKNSSSTKRIKPALFPPHISTSQLLLGVKGGSYYQGNIRAKRASSSSPNTYFQCYVTVRRGDERIAVNITDRHNVNRAVDGDVVAIQLHSVQEWYNNNDDNKANQQMKAKKETVGVAQETAEPSLRDEENIQDSLVIPTEKDADNDDNDDDDDDKMVQCQPTGKVVGIVRRNFRQNYCGSIYDSKTSTSKHKHQNDDETNSNTQTNDSIADECEAEHADGSSTCVFFAVDARIPPILIRTTQKERLLGKRILCAIDSWPVDSPYPLGHYVKTIGEAGSKDVETEVLLHEHDIPCDPFPAKVSI